MGVPNIQSPMGTDYQASLDTEESQESVEEEGPTQSDAQLLLDPNNKYPCGESAISPGMSPDYFPKDDDGDEISGGRLAEPNVFPWMMRLCWSKESNGTEYYCGCGATLITRLHALTSFNCINNKEDKESCDEISPHVAMGHFFVIPGTNLAEEQGSMDSIRSKHYEVKEVHYHRQTTKKYGIYGCKGSRKGHNIALLRLEKRVPLSATIRHICLTVPAEAPEPGMRTVAAGWGMQATAEGKADHWTRRDSRLLKRVNLAVSAKKQTSTYLFGTTVEFKRGEYQDPCAGDGGGPLMTYDEPKIKNGRERWYILGVLYGGGFDCRTGAGNPSDGMWTKVWRFVSWMENIIKRTT